jgi:AcrR family transcriptional regulator
MKVETGTNPTRTRDPEGTREAILQAAFQEIYRSGFRSAGLDAILKGAGVTKGALYHHFGSKAGLGLAVLREVVKTLIFEHFLGPVEAASNPIDGLIEMAQGTIAEVTPQQVELGCPLNNLAQEMSAVDEDFRLELAEIFDDWRRRLARCLERGQRNGSVRPDVDPESAATFIIAAWEGAIGLVKTSREAQILTEASQGLFTYLETLRPRTA